MLYKEQLDLDRFADTVEVVEIGDPEPDPPFEDPSSDSRFQLWLVCLLAVVLLLTIVIAPAAVSADARPMTQGPGVAAG